MVNVVALFVILVSIIPVYIATRLAGASGITGGAAEAEHRGVRTMPSRSGQPAVTPVPIGHETPVPPRPQ